MAKDYTRNIATAQRLITKFGRAVTLVAFDEAPADVSKPWQGAADARATGTTVALDAAFVQPGGDALELGFSTEIVDLMKRSEQLLIVSLGATADLTIYEEVIDTDLSRWKITGIQTLKPGTDVILGFIGVKR